MKTLNQATQNWIKIYEVTHQSIDKIIQSTISIKMTTKKFTHKTEKFHFLNWATTLERNGPKEIPRNEKTGHLKIVLSDFVTNRLKKEFEPFMKNKEFALNFILKKELNVFLKCTEKGLFTITYQQSYESAGMPEGKWANGPEFGSMN